MSIPRPHWPVRFAGPAFASLLLAGAALPACAQTAPAAPNKPAAPAATPGTPNVQDPYLAQWLRLTPERRPVPQKPGVDYGMDPATGQFIWPKATPEVHTGQKFPGEMTSWDKQSLSLIHI